MKPIAIETERVGDLIVQVVYDEGGFADNPRDESNIAHIYGSHRSYTIGDGESPSDHMRALERGGIRLLYRYLRLTEGIVAFVKLGIYDHSGVAFFPVEIGNNGHHVFDEAGWDSGVVGYAYIDRATWDKEMSGSPDELIDSDETWPRGLGGRDGKVARAKAVIAGEIARYGAWANGEVYGYVVTRPCNDADEHGSDEAIAACPHAEVVDSCWGYIGEADYALSEGKDAAKYANEHPEVAADV